MATVRERTKKRAPPTEPTTLGSIELNQWIIAAKRIIFTKTSQITESSVFMRPLNTSYKQVTSYLFQPYLVAQYIIHITTSHSVGIHPVGEANLYYAGILPCSGGFLYNSDRFI